MRIEYKTGGQRTVRASIGRRLVRVGIAREVEIEKSGTYMTRDMRAQPVPAADPTDGDLAALRAEYQEAVGKRAFHGWDADTLREKIAEVRE